MDRRNFINTAAVTATGLGGVLALSTPALGAPAAVGTPSTAEPGRPPDAPAAGASHLVEPAPAPSTAPIGATGPGKSWARGAPEPVNAPPVERPASGPVTKRWMEQRWLLDSAIAVNGVDWDQPRSIYWNTPCGMEAGADFAGIRARVRKFADFSPAFASVAQRREARARVADAAGQQVTARENYFMAAIHWAAAQWPIYENSVDNLRFNARKRECYSRYAELADHRVEAVSIPFEGGSLPAWFHLPPGYTGGRLPTVVSVTGMDNFKEASVGLQGDRFLGRGFAVLAIEGPGQYEAPQLGVYLSVPAWEKTGTACVDWLVRRGEVDPERIVLSGVSFGSFGGLIAAAHEPRFAACATMNSCFQPGWTMAFGEASPTYKMRFMYMAKHTDEAAFDEFSKTLTWEGHAERLRMPFLALAGGRDELSPLADTERMVAALPGPKQLVVYQDSRHSIGGVPSASLGPFAPTLVADWLAARVRGASFASERWEVDATGSVKVTPL